jgi:hypothetical protein
MIWPHKCKWVVVKKQNADVSMNNPFFGSRDVSGYIFLKKCSKCGKEKAEFNAGSKVDKMDVDYVKAWLGEQ